MLAEDNFYLFEQFQLQVQLLFFEVGLDSTSCVLNTSVNTEFRTFTSDKHLSRSASFLRNVILNVPIPEGISLGNSVLVLSQVHEIEPGYSREDFATPGRVGFSTEVRRC